MTPAKNDNTSSDYSVLIVILGHDLKVARLRDSISKTLGNDLLIEGHKFRDLGQGVLTGIYDWLRTAEGGIAGIRYLPENLPKNLWAQLHDRRYLKVIGSDILEIYFTPENAEAIDETKPCDQDFGDNIILTADNGDVAISFGTKSLSLKDTQSIEALDLNWVDAHML